MRERLLTLASLVAIAGCDGSTQPASPAAIPAPVVSRTPIPPEELFNKHGCPTCHAKGAKHEDKLVQSAGKPVEVVAEWIRHPQRKKPGTEMPTYATLIDETEARALAAWIQARAAAQRDGTR